MANSTGNLTTAAEIGKKGNIVDKTSDQWYLDYIKKYENSEFYEELLNNPYLQEKNKNYEPGFWGSIGEAFGISSGRQAYEQDLVQARNERLAQIEGMIREQERNEPSAEIARRKAAGLNDDLNGGEQIGTGEAAQNDQPIESPEQMNSAGDTIQGAFSTLWNVFTSAYSVTMGLMQDVQTMKQAKNATEAGEIDNFLKYLTAGMEAHNMSYASNGYGNKDDSISGNFIPEEWFTQFFKNSKRAKKFKQAMGIAASSAMGNKKLYENESSLHESILKHEETKGKLDAAMNWPEELLRDFAHDMFKAKMDLERRLMKLNLKKASNEYTYESKRDYGSLATFDNMTVGANIKKIEMQKVLNSFMSEWTKKLEKISEEGGWKGTGASVMLGFLSMKQMDLLPSIPSMKFSANTFVK